MTYKTILISGSLLTILSAASLATVSAPESTLIDPTTLAIDYITTQIKGCSKKQKGCHDTSALPALHASGFSKFEEAKQGCLDEYLGCLEELKSRCILDCTTHLTDNGFDKKTASDTCQKKCTA